MHCQPVMQEYILAKMPSKETIVEIRESQEISGRFYTQFIFTRSILKSSGQLDLPHPPLVMIELKEEFANSFYWRI